MAQTRGSWLIDQAVSDRWDSAGLDGVFRAEWTNPNDTAYEPLNDGDARPTPPGPYCCYEKQPPLILGHDSGKFRGTFNQLQQVTIQFTIHAKTTSSESGKAIAQRLAEQVAEAFDPDNTALGVAPDGDVNVVRGPDWHVREGDQEWAWVLQYDITIDAEYGLRQASA